MSSELGHGIQAGTSDNGSGRQEPEINCPACGLDALYKYGTAHTGNKRFLCIICGRQFTLSGKKPVIRNKPICQQCGRQMNINSFEGEVIRLRCSGYPECKTFKKFRLTEETK